jgi:hypothetical protein
MDTAYFKNLPTEMIKEILLQTDLPDIRSMCTTDIHVQQFCNDENFWLEYIDVNYKPNIFKMINFENLVSELGTSWKEIAYAYQFGNPVNLYVVAGTLGEKEIRKFISVTPDMLIKDVFDMVNDSVNDMLRNDMSLKEIFNISKDKVYQLTVGDPTSSARRSNFRLVSGEIQVYDNNFEHWFEYDFSGVPIGETKLYDLLLDIDVYLDQQ